MFVIKVKEPNGKIWRFLTSSGGTNRLRIHAAQFSDRSKADAIALEIAENNVGWSARVDSF